MIVCDSSPLVAIFLAENDANSYIAAMSKSDNIVIGAPNKLEVSMVMGGRFGLAGINEVQLFLEINNIKVLSWTDELANTAARAFLRFGKGRNHPAKLNFGDCMAYALAKSLNAPLLFKGKDFAQTDVRSAL